MLSSFLALERNSVVQKAVVVRIIFFSILICVSATILTRLISPSGACTVLVSSYDTLTQKINHNSVNACLVPLCSVEGKHVITIEGIGNVNKPHPVQVSLEAFSMMY